MLFSENIFCCPKPKVVFSNWRSKYTKCVWRWVLQIMSAWIGGFNVQALFLHYSDIIFKGKREHSPFIALALCPLVLFHGEPVRIPILRQLFGDEVVMAPRIFQPYKSWARARGFNSRGFMRGARVPSWSSSRCAL